MASITYDDVIDCAVDLEIDIDFEKKVAGTGDLAAYSGISGLTYIISATRGSSTPIDASLSQSATERVSTPGRAYAVFDVADLQSYLLPTYEGQIVYLNVFRSGEIYYQPFRLLVQGDRLGV